MLYAAIGTQLVACPPRDLVVPLPQTGVRSALSLTSDRHRPSCLLTQFLDFFFTRIKINDTGFHPSYPFISMCGKEHNFILPVRDLPADVNKQHTRLCTGD